MRHPAWRCAPVVALLLALTAPAQRPEPERGPEKERAGESKERPEEGKEAERGEGKERTGEEFPAPLDWLAEALNPGRLQRRLDEARGRDVDRSDRPQAAEFPLAVFVESVRPLGALAYENQLNYLAAGFSGDAPSLQTMTFEYVFADWNAARFELIAPRGRLDAVGLGYQRTLDVGERGNWAHGFLVLPEFSTTGSGFVGGSAFYTAVWKPDRESPWTVGGSAGANRASFDNRPLGAAAEGGVGSMAMRMPGEAAETRAEESRVWRPFLAANAWYTLSKELTLGLEADAFPHHRFGEYLIQPNLTWRPVKHFFVQLGAGYYEASGHGQATFMVRVNLLNPSPREGRREE